MDGYRVLPFDKLKAEFFYPEMTENISTKALSTNIDVDMDSCILNELRYPKKATYDYLYRGEGKFSWVYTNQEEHQDFIVMMASNDPSESPFTQITRQIQSFGRILGINAAAVGYARQNGDFRRSSGDYELVRSFQNISGEMRESLLRFSISFVPTVNQGERYAIERQREAKWTKKEAPQKKKLLAEQKEYVSSLTYIEMYHSQACFR